MNQQAHRLTFNKSRGSIMVVSDSDSSSGKSASGSAGPRSSRTCAKALAQPFQASNVPAAAVLLTPIAINLVAPSPTAHYLAQTDPAFASYRNWLGSDYLLQALGYDPVTIQKRLGDGFYEQRLVREQVAQLTGQRFLADYSSDEQQYKALMNAGVTFAQSWQLRPGIALSAAQMAQLTSDIVWLVEQSVTLADGSTSKVLVPQVYVRVQPGDLDGTGALLAGKSVNINTTGDITNTGTISGSVAGRKIVSVTADNIHNLGGRITGDTVALAARGDLNNIGGQIDAANALSVSAGRDLSITSTTSSGASQIGLNSFSRTGLDRIAGLYVNNPGGSLIASAGRDVNLTAAIVQSQGSAGITAGNNINLATVVTSQSANSVRDARNYVRASQSEEVGSQINASGKLTLQAGNNINARAASVQSQQGVELKAAGNVTLNAGLASNNFEDAQFAESRGLLSSSSQTSRVTQNSTQASGTSIGGSSVNISAGKDIKVKGSSVISDSATTLRAGNNVNLEAASNTSSSTSFLEKKESGFLSGGGFGMTYGNREQSTDNKGQSTTAAASTVGSISGNVTINAGQAYRQVGSDVMAPGGDISITARKVDIIEARETSQRTTEQKFSQSGLTLAVTSPILSALQTMSQMAQAAGNTSDGRMKALAGANAGFAANNAANAIKAGQGSLINGKEGQIATTNADGTAGSRDATDADRAGGINVALSFGSSSSQSNSTSQSDSARGSTVTASGNVLIAATGAGQASDLTVRGSRIEAGQSAVLLADNQIRLLAAQNTASQAGTSKSSSASIGVSYGTDGLLLNLSASGAKGKLEGSDTNYSNTHVSAGHTVVLQSGADTSLRGAVVQANTVIAQVGGNLNIESLQDTSTYASKNQSLGGSVSVGYGKMSGSLSASQSKTDSNFKSVTEQSGIKAGDGGFNVAVNSNTDLKGAVIASNQAAVDNNQNSFTTGGRLSTSDLQNSASYSASKTSLGTGAGYAGSTASSNGLGIGLGSDKGNANSTTTSGISGIAGNTAVRSTDAQSGLKPIFDAAKVQREIDAQAEITQAFGKEASKAVGTFAAEKLQAAQAIGDQTEIDQWKEGGLSRVALHILVGGLGGGMGGALGAASSQTLVPLLGEEIAKLNIPVELKQALAAIAGATIGTITGGAAGAASGLAATTNNYLTATDLRSKEQKIQTCRSQGNAQCEVNVLKEYDFKSAKNSGQITYTTVMSELVLKGEKDQLELLLLDPGISNAGKAEARRSIAELNVAINVIQKSPVLRDAAELGLLVADVALLGEFAVAKTLTSTFVKQFVAARTGKEITPDAAAMIANNFYRDGTELPQALATSSGIVIQAAQGRTTTVLGNYVNDMRGIITEQTGIPKSMGYLDAKPGGFNVLNVPDEYASTLMRQNPEAFWNQVNKPFLDASSKHAANTC